ncbi:MAG TPA: redoxin domain-containing protein, partial [Nitrospirota bacterium]
MTFGNRGATVARIFVLMLVLSALPAWAAIKVSDPAPVFSLQDREGKEFSLSSVVGAEATEKSRGVVLGFFATWCGGCRNELPIINSLVDELKSKG